MLLVFLMVFVEEHYLLFKNKRETKEVVDQLKCLHTGNPGLIPGFHLDL